MLILTSQGGISSKLAVGAFVNRIGCHSRETRRGSVEVWIAFAQATLLRAGIVGFIGSDKAPMDMITKALTSSHDVCRTQALRNHY